LNANRCTVRLLRTLFVAVWLLSGCSVAWAQEKVTLRLDFIPNGYHGPFYMALDKGYYREEGLDVQIGRGFGTVDTIKRVDAGADTFGFADFYTAVKAMAEGAKFQAIGAGLGDTVGCVAAQRKSGIRTIKDLEGRSLASSAGDAYLAQLPSVFKAAGVDMSKVNVVLMDIVVRPSAFVAGKVDSVMCSTVSSLQALLSQGQDLVVFEYRDHISVAGSGIIASEATIRSRPEVIRKFLKATYRGARDFARDPAAASAILVRYHPEGSADSYTGQAKASAGIWANAVAKQRGFGWMDDAKMLSTLEQATRDFKLERKLAARDFYTNEFVPVPPIR
jgi:NitT/TauT family transport system substrate-binding protein